MGIWNKHSFTDTLKCSIQLREMQQYKVISSIYFVNDKVHYLTSSTFKEEGGGGRIWPDWVTYHRSFVLLSEVLRKEYGLCKQLVISRGVANFEISEFCSHARKIQKSTTTIELRRTFGNGNKSTIRTNINIIAVCVMCLSRKRVLLSLCNMSREKEVCILYLVGTRAFFVLCNTECLPPWLELNSGWIINVGNKTFYVRCVSYELHNTNFGNIELIENGVKSILHNEIKI